MPPQEALKVGDEVRVKRVDAFNLEWLKSTYPSTWMHEKFQGNVSAKAGAKWAIDFIDGEKVTLTRPKIEFLSRPKVTSKTHAAFFNEEPNHDSKPIKSGKK